MIAALTDNRWRSVVIRVVVVSLIWPAGMLLGGIATGASAEGTAEASVFVYLLMLGLTLFIARRMLPANDRTEDEIARIRNLAVSGPAPHLAGWELLLIALVAIVPSVVLWSLVRPGLGWMVITAVPLFELMRRALLARRRRRTNAAARPGRT